jgi:Flp pilus assembly protein TadD
MKKLVVIMMLAAMVLTGETSVFTQTKSSTSQKATEKKITAPAKKKTLTKKKSSTAKSGNLVSKENDPAVGKTQSGKIVFEGDRGGHYYLTETGNRVYVQDFAGAKIIGKTPDGLNIYEGPRGGHFYYNKNGDKVYVKR